MGSAAIQVGAGGNNHQHPAAAVAHLHSKLQLTDGMRNIQLVSRNLLAQPNPLILEDADDALYLALAICGGIGLLILLTFGVMWCIYASKRRTRLPSADGSESTVTDADGEFIDEDKLATGFSRGDAHRSVAYGSERKLAMSAQLYHYEKQKRELLALEQGNQNEPDPPPRGTPPPAYNSLMSGLKSRDAAREDSKSIKSNSDVTQRARVASGGNDEEEFAVYEYPGLVTTVGQIEIDNPLFRAPSANYDSADRSRRSDAADVDADVVSPFGALPVQIVRQQPDLLASVDEPTALSNNGSTRKSKRKGKHRETPSPIDASQSAASSSSASKSIEPE